MNYVYNSIRRLTEEEQKAQAERERRLTEEEQKIENLRTMVINSAMDDRDLDRRNMKVSMSVRFIYFHLCCQMF